MKFIRKFDHYITLLFFLTIFAVVAISYFTFKEVIDKYNKNQHQAVIPLFSIINSEIIRPLDTAYFMAHDSFIHDYIEQENIDQAVLFNYLKNLSQSYNMLTFIALEKHGYSIDSNNKKQFLNNEESEWYQRLKVKNASQFADIGNAEDPHLYFDIKIFNEQQKFLGFIGVGIDLNHFSTVFNEYHQRFGFELILVDQDNNITLASNHFMKTESHHRADELKNINLLPWHKKLVKKLEMSNIKQTVTSIEDDDRIVSQLPLKELNWNIYLISPPAIQQNEYWQLFATRLSIFIISMLGLYYIFYSIINYFKHNLVKNAETDYLTQLPNRSFIHWNFEQLAKTYENICVVIADIDNFKRVNDTYGHVVGDEVLKAIAEQLKANLRQHDMSCRWGGEEFVLLLPNTSQKLAMEIIERIRERIAATAFHVSGTNEVFNATVSFGVFQTSSTSLTFEQMIDNADQALYNAKNNGRNRVELFCEKDNQLT